MMIVLRRLLATTFLLVFALTGESGLAQVPSGAITNRIVGLTNAVWDVSLLQGVQSLSVFASYGTNALQVGFEGPYIQDGRGRLTGKGTNSIFVSFMQWTGNIFGNPWADVGDVPAFDGKYAAHGSIVGLKGVAVMNFISRALGQTVLQQKTVHVSASRAFYLVLSASGHTFKGRDANIIYLSGQHSFATGSPQTGALPSYFGNGSWTVVLNFDAAATRNPNRLSGNGTLTLNSGASFPLHFTGRYITTKGQSQLLLRGVKTDAGDGRGVTLSVTLAGSRIIGVLGRIAGQTVSLK